MSEIVTSCIDKGSLMPTKPFIGIILDYEEGGPTAYSKFPWYALRVNYSDMVTENGGIPLFLPYDLINIDVIANLIQGLIIAGGNFDIPPELYGDSELHETVFMKRERTMFETLLFKKMLDTKKPILGICGGEQLINVALGGSLIQHIPDSIVHSLQHEQTQPFSQPSHCIIIEEDTLLHSIVKEPLIYVNSSHHQAVNMLAPGVIANARAVDGVIEGIEYPAHPFCLGVQYHPEYKVSPADTALFKAFIDACA